MRLRALAMPLVAVLLAALVLGIQAANGGGEFTPARAASPCTPRRVTSVSTGIEGLGEQLVLLGLDGAACRLGVTREALLLRLAEQDHATDAQVNAVRAGLLGAVTRLEAEGRLPQPSTLADEAVDESSLNGFVKALVKALPNSLINKSLSTGDVLRRAIGDLDLRKVLDNLDDPDTLTAEIRTAMTKAVRDALIAKLRGLI